jgi:sugar lactone lactonase YvrE
MTCDSSSIRLAVSPWKAAAEAREQRRDVRRRFGLIACVWSVAALAAVGCGDDDDVAQSNVADTAQNNATDAAVTTDFISLADGSPEATFWDASKSVLYIADNKDNQIWSWTDRAGLTPLAKLPLPEGESALPDNVSLGQEAVLQDGTVVVTRFGQPGGGWGGIGYVTSDNQAKLVPGLDPKRRRLGLVTAPDGTLYGSYFTGSQGNLSGFLTKVDLANGETEIADGFGKIVGLAVDNDKLYVSDQSNGQVLDAPLAALPAKAADWHVTAKFPAPDVISVGPDGSLFSGQFQTAAGSTDPIAVRWIKADGSVVAFKADPDVSKPSGVSYDAQGKRLFVADAGNPVKIGVYIFPVP